MGDLLIVFTVGSVAGVLGGFFGIAGGVIIVPALIFVLGMPTKAAVGTSFGALLPPVGIFGAWVYWRDGSLDIRYAALLALGLAAGPTSAPSSRPAFPACCSSVCSRFFWPPSPPGCFFPAKKLYGVATSENSARAKSGGTRVCASRPN